MFKRGLAFATVVTLCSFPALADTPRDVRDLVGVSARGGENALNSRGYRHINTQKGNDRAWSNWWNSRNRECITVVTMNGRYDAINSSLPIDCGYDDNSSSSSSSNNVNNAAAEVNCVSEVRRRSGNNVRNMQILDSIFSQAATEVIVSADGVRWRCLANSQGRVSEVSRIGGYDSGGHNSNPGYGHSSRDEVTLYEDSDFRGASESFSNDVANLSRTRIGNDEASSIRVPSGCTATLYRDSEFRGRSTELRRDEDSLRNTPIGNDELSSMRVDCGRNNPGDDYDYGNNNSNRDGVTLYRDSRFRGQSITLYGDESELRNTRLGNDELSSIRVPRGCEVTVFEDSKYRGRSETLYSDESDMDDTRVGNDEASSIRVDC